MKKIVKITLLSLSIFIFLFCLLVLLSLIGDFSTLKNPSSAITPIPGAALLNAGLITLTVWAYKWDEGTNNKNKLTLSVVLIAVGVIAIFFAKLINSMH